ncbi:MAG TPA: PAS domain S-box protein [Bryobacteraceae bacterium]|nr:PAS domain S-box protein [Bryobacteraceae bacterium]
MWRATGSGGSLDCFSQPFHDYTGLFSVKLYGSEWKTAVHREDIEEFETWWRDIEQSREACITEVRLRRFDGEYRWFQIAVTPVLDEQGNLVRWCGISIDVDERKCAEQKLRQDDWDLRTIIDAIRQTVVALAPDGTTLYANRVALEITPRLSFLPLLWAAAQGWRARRSSTG